MYDVINDIVFTTKKIFNNIVKIIWVTFVNELFIKKFDTFFYKK